MSRLFFVHPDLAPWRALEDGYEEKDGVEDGVYENEALGEPPAYVAVDGAKDPDDEEEDRTFGEEEGEAVDGVGVVGELSQIYHCLWILIGLRTLGDGSLGRGLPSAGIGHASHRDSTCECHRREYRYSILCLDIP